MLVLTSELFRVCMRGNVQVLRKLFELPPRDGVTTAQWAAEHPEVNAVDDEGSTLLHVACKRGLGDMAMFLLDECHVNSSADAEGNTPLHLVCMQDTENLEIVEAMATAWRADVGRQNAEGNTPIGLACRQGHLQIVRLLVSSFGADVNAVSADGTAPIHHACAAGNVDAVRFLAVDCGADPDLGDKDGRTAVHVTCENGHLELLKFLTLECRADASRPDAGGKTPLHAAAAFRRLALVHFLVEVCAVDGSKHDAQGNTPIHCACSSPPRWIDGANGPDFDIVRFLVTASRADATAPDSEGCTPLWRACSAGAPLDTVRFLVQDCEADVNIANEKGETALHHLNNCPVDVIEFLLHSAGGDVNVAAEDGSTAFSNCFGYRPTDVTKPKLLVAHGASVDGGKALLKCAKYMATLPVVQWLVAECGADTNVASDMGRTAIMEIFDEHYGDISDMIAKGECLRAGGADVDRVDEDGNTALHLLCANYDLHWRKKEPQALDMIEFLVVKCAANVNIENKEGKTPLEILVMDKTYGRFPLDAVKILVQGGGANTNIKDKDGATLLHEAAWEGNLDVVTFLVRECGADASTADDKGRTPLHRAAASFLSDPAPAVVKFLVSECGADPRCCHSDGSSAMHDARSAGMARLLATEYGIKVNVSNTGGITPLMAAVSFWSVDLDLVKALVGDLGAKVDAVDHDGNSALHAVCKNNRLSSPVEVLDFLVKSGANVNLENNRGQTPAFDTINSRQCFSAREFESLALQFLATTAGCDINHADCEGNTLLHVACRNGLAKVISFLVQECAADLNCRNDARQRPLQLVPEPRGDFLDLLADLGLAIDNETHEHAGAAPAAASGPADGGGHNGSYHGLTDPLYYSSDRLPSVFWSPAFRAYPPNLQRRMWSFAGALRRKRDWPRKIATADVRAKWKQEAVESCAASGIYFPPAAAERVVNRVLQQAVQLGNDASVRPSPVDGVWESDVAVGPELVDRLRVCADALRRVEPVDYHPGSDGLVVDLLHPSLFCYVSGVTQVSRAVGNGTVQAAVPNEVQDKARVFQWLPTVFDVDDAGATTICSPIVGHFDTADNAELYQTLSAAFAACVPMLERVLEDLKNPTHRDGLEVQLRPRPVGVHYFEGPENQFCLAEIERECNDDAGDYAVLNVEMGTVGAPGVKRKFVFANGKPRPDSPSDDDADLASEPVDVGPDVSDESAEDHGLGEDNSEAEDEEEELEYEELRKLAGGYLRALVAKRGLKKTYEPGTEPRVLDFAPSRRPYASVVLRGRRLRVIPKLATIELSPDKPSYGGGAWHVEGEPQECIVATAICYFNQENITASRLRFRAAVEGDSVAMSARGHDDPNVAEYVGLKFQDSRLSIDVGFGDCVRGRSIAFPNTLQHRVDPFRLADPTKPGHRTILAFFLVDPAVPVLSTLDVCLQSRPCLIKLLMGCRAFQRLSVDVIRIIVGFVEGTYNLETAKQYREELMDARRSANRRLEELFVDTDFSLCEH